MQLLHEILVVLGLAAVVVFVGQKLKVPSIVAFLVAGVATGPGGLRIIHDPEEVETLSEIGILLLLFTIGLEFSMKQLVSIRKAVFLAGTVQAILTFAAGFGIGRVLGLATNESVLIGILLALSSTAIMLKLLQDRAELDTPHGRAALGISIFQDLLVVPCMLLLPFLAGANSGNSEPAYFLVGKIALVVFAVLVCTKWVVPFILLQIARTRSRELFLLTVISLAFGIAWFASALSLSLSLGAFLAGLVISESAYGHQALGSILPFRDVFLSFFFVAAGMLLDLRFLVDHAPLVLGLTVAALLLKALFGGVASLALRQPVRTAVLVGAAIAAESEFNFVLAKAGHSLGLLSPTTYQTVLAVVILTMACSPILYAFAPALARVAARFAKTRDDARPSEAPPGGNHLLIVGYGLNGKNLGRAAKRLGIPYTVIEMNPDTVRREKAAGVPMNFGDATNEAVLHTAGVMEARVAVVAINDPVATRRIVELLRRLSPTLHVIARTRFVLEMKHLAALGANEVVPEEFETSVEIFARVMKRYLLSPEEIDGFISEIRAEGYEMLRGAAPPAPAADGLAPLLAEVDVSVLKVEAGAPVAGKSLADLALRSRHGISVLAIQQAGKLVASPGAGDRIEAGDRVIVLGPRESVRAAGHLFHSPPAGAAPQDRPGPSR